MLTFKKRENSGPRAQKRRPTNNATTPSSGVRAAHLVGRTLGVDSRTSASEQRAHAVERWTLTDSATGESLEPLGEINQSRQAEVAARALNLSPGRRPAQKVNDRLRDGLGADANDLTIHDTGSDAEVADSLGARALTLGNHVVFAKGHYQPDSQQGFALLAHEASHAATPSHTGPMIQLATKDISENIRDNEPITGADIEEVYYSGLGERTELRGAMIALRDDESQPLNVRETAFEILEYMTYLDVLQEFTSDIPLSPPHH